MKNNPEAFCYWLQGYAELFGKAPTQEQWKIIVAHLEYVFDRVIVPKAAEKPEDSLPEITKEGKHIDWSKYLPKEAPIKEQPFVMPDWTKQPYWLRNEDFPNKLTPIC